MSIHIEALKNDISDKVIMPGDPLRAKYIATNFLTDVKLVNDVRNMLGYTGYYKDKKITVIGSGMGIASMGIYSYELFKFYDVNRIIRIGTCGSMQRDVRVNDLILATSSYSVSSFCYVWDKTVDNLICSSKSLNDKIKSVSINNNLDIKSGTIFTSDVFSSYTDISHILDKVPKHINLLAVEMESFSLFHMANYFNKEASTILSVVDSPYENIMLSQEEKETKLNDMIVLALDSI